MSDKNCLKTIRKLGLNMMERLHLFCNRMIPSHHKWERFCAFILILDMLKKPQHLGRRSGFYFVSLAKSFSGAVRDRIWQVPSRNLTSFSQKLLFLEFWHGSIQLTSGESLVVFNKNDTQVHVYKYSFGHEESHRLFINKHLHFGAWCHPRLIYSTEQ